MNKTEKITLFIVFSALIVTILAVFKETSSGAAGYGRPAIMWIAAVLIPILYASIFKKSKDVDNNESMEFKQLDNLYREGVLTKEEYENKTNLLRKQNDEQAMIAFEKKLDIEVEELTKHQINQLEQLEKNGILTRKELIEKIETVKTLSRSKLIDAKRKEKNNINKTAKTTGKLEIKLNNNTKIYVNEEDYTELEVGLSVYDSNLEPLSSGFYMTEYRRFKVEKGCIIDIEKIFRYNVKDLGEIIICQNINGIEGERVLLNDKPISDGIYKINLLKKIKIKNGVIVG